MKKIFTILTTLLITISVFSQTPQLLNYQVVIRDSKYNLIKNKSIGIRASILKGSSSGTLVYEETYSPNPQTNVNGMVTVTIGSGNVINGSFSGINWSNGSYYVKIETDLNGGTNFSFYHTEQLLSVPYALSAMSESTLSVTGTTGQTLMNNGTTWVANSTLYNSGTNVGIGTTSPSSSAILDLSSTKSGALVPRLSTAQMNSISAPAKGLLIYNTDCNNFYYNSGTSGTPKWQSMISSTSLGTPGYISGPACGNQGQAGVIYSIAAVSGATSYAWTVPSGATITSGRLTTSITVNFGTNSGNVCVSALNSCVTSESSCIGISVGGTLTAGTISGNQTICSGVTATTLTQTPPSGSSGNFTYQWYNDFGSIAGATHSTYSPGIQTSLPVIKTESFDGTTFPPAGWAAISLVNDNYNWERTVAGNNGVDLDQLPHSGSGEAWYDCWDAAVGDESILVSPSFTEVGNVSGAEVSFWMYGNTANGSSYTDLVNVYYSTSVTQPQDLSNATLLGTVYQYNPDNGWYKHTFTIPASVTSSKVWLIFDAVSDNGIEVYLDDVSWTSYPSVTNIHYYCVESNGSCGNASTNTVTISVNTLPTASVTGNLTICSGNSTTLTASGSGTYKWSTGATTASITVNPTSNTYYTITVTNTVGCIKTVITTVTVNTTVPSPPVAGTNTPSTRAIVWNWNTVSNATGYKWATVNDYSLATDIGTNTSYTQKRLTCNTSYTAYVWAYNTCGNSVSAALIQMTAACFPCGSVLTDERDKQSYTTVKIGTQCWMAQNLNYGTFVLGATGEAGVGPQKLCYNDSIQNCSIYGGLYYWGETMDGINKDNTDAIGAGCNGIAPPPNSNAACTNEVQGICPSDWHVPSLYEWILLFRKVGGSDSTAFPYSSPDMQAHGINEGADLMIGGSSGFNALYAGQYGGSFTMNANTSSPLWAFWCSTSYDAGNGYTYVNAVASATYFSSTPDAIWMFGIGPVGGLTPGSPANGAGGYSVRCVND